MIASADMFFTVLFALEMLIKWIGLGLSREPDAYFNDYWNWLDFMIVVESIISLSLTNSGGQKALEGLSAIRAFRVLRPLRSITRLKGLRIIVVRV